MWFFWIKFFKFYIYEIFQEFIKKNLSVFFLSVPKSTSGRWTISTINRFYLLYIKKRVFKFYFSRVSLKFEKKSQKKFFVFLILYCFLSFVNFVCMCVCVSNLIYRPHRCPYPRLVEDFEVNYLGNLDSAIRTLGGPRFSLHYPVDLWSVDTRYTHHRLHTTSTLIVSTLSTVRTYQFPLLFNLHGGEILR